MTIGRAYRVTLHMWIETFDCELEESTPHHQAEHIKETVERFTVGQLALHVDGLEKRKEYELPA